MNAPIQILLIDDYEDMLELNRLLLEEEGFQVSTAKNSRQAMEYLEGGKRFDVILLDYILNEMNGDELLELMFQRFPGLRRETPVVYMSGYPNLKPGKASGVIPKSSSTEEFVARVRSHARSDRSSEVSNSTGTERAS